MPQFPEVRGWNITYSVIAVGVGDAVFLAANVNRVGLILTCNNATRYTVSTAGAAVLDQGLTMPAGGANLVLQGESLYPLTKAALRAIGAGAISVGVWEFIRF